MKRLLRLEFRKVSRQIGFYICLATTLLLMFLGTRVELFAIELLAGIPLMGQDVGTSIMLGAIDTSFFCTAAGIFVALFVCSDYSQHTIKGILARGYTRTQVFFSKLITAWTGATVMYLVVLIASFFMAIAYLDEGFTNFGKLLGVLGVQYIVNMTYVAIYFSVGIMFGGLGATIPVGLFAPFVIRIILAVFGRGLSLEKYWISMFSTELEYLDVSVERMVTCLLLSLLYTVVFLGVGWFVHQKKEIK